jgi:hypothetical protein
VNIKHGVAEVITLGNCESGHTVAVLKRHFADQPRYFGNVLSVDKHLVHLVHERTGECIISPLFPSEPQPQLLIGIWNVNQVVDLVSLFDSRKH